MNDLSTENNILAFTDFANEFVNSAKRHKKWTKTNGLKKVSLVFERFFNASLIHPIYRNREKKQNGNYIIIIE